MMFTIKLALKHLLSSKKQSALIIVAVALGVLVIIYIPSINLGFYEELLNKTINTSPHISITRYEDIDEIESLEVINNRWILNKNKTMLINRRIQSYKSVISQIRKIKGIEAYSPYVINNGTLINGEKNLNVTYYGILYPKEQEVVDIDKDLVIGSYEKLNPDGVAISQRMASKLKVYLGDTVILSTSTSSKVLKVVALYNSGFYNKDSTTIYISMNTAQSLLNIGNQVDGIGIKTKDPWKVKELAQTITYKTGLQAKSWQDDNASLLSEIATFYQIVAIINLTIMLAVAAGVLGIMIIMINAKQKQIGMLKALGVTSFGVIKIFVLEGVILSLLGALVGSLLSTGAIAYYNAHPFEVQENYGVSDMRAIYDLGVYAQATLLSLLSGSIAALIPAYFASKVEPAEVLKST